MNLLTLVSSCIVTLSFLAYGIGSVSIMNLRVIDFGTLLFLSLGFMLDIVATILFGMRSNISNVFHFLILHSITYIALSAMLLNLVWCWKLVLSYGLNTKVGKTHIIYTKVAWIFWSVTYIVFIFKYIK